MQTRTKIAALAAFALAAPLAFGLTTHAEPPRGQQTGLDRAGAEDSHPGHRGGERHRMDPSERGEMRLERLAERLNLTEEQKAAFEAAHSSSFETQHESMIGLHEARKALDAAIDSDVFDENAIRDAAAEVAVLEADQAVERAQRMAEIRTILTPEQWATFQTVQERRKPAMRGERRHRAH